MILDRFPRNVFAVKSLMNKQSIAKGKWSHGLVHRGQQELRCNGIRHNIPTVNRSSVSNRHYTSTIRVLPVINRDTNNDTSPIRVN